MIVVTGATGKLGRLVLDALLQTVPAAELAIAVRTPSKAVDLAARGVQVRHADYDRPETLSATFRPGEKVLLISANEVGKRGPQHLRVIEAARAANVGLLAYTSLLRADRSTMILAEEHRTTEEGIRASGLPYVFLRNGWYLENHTEQLDGIVERGAIIGAAANGRFASAARRDYAAAAAAVLTAANGAGNKVYELAGDGFTLDDFAAEVTKQSGRKVAYSNLTPEQYKEALVGSGMPAAVAGLVADFDRAAAHGDLDGSSDDLRRLIGRPPTTLSEAIAAAFTNRRLQAELGLLPVQQRCCVRKRHPWIVHEVAAHIRQLRREFGHPIDHRPNFLRHECGPGAVPRSKKAVEALEESIEGAE